RAGGVVDDATVLDPPLPGGGVAGLDDHGVPGLRQPVRRAAPRVPGLHTEQVRGVSRDQRRVLPVDRRLHAPAAGLGCRVPVPHARLDPHVLHGAHGAVDGDAHVVRRDGAVPGAGPHGPTSVAVKETSLARLPRPSSASTTSLENFSTTTLSTPCPTDHSTGPSVHVTCGRATTSAHWTASVHAAAPAGGVAVTVDRRRPSMPVTRLPLDCVPTRPPVTSCHRTTTRAPASRAVASCAEAVTDLPVHCGGIGHGPTSTAARFPNAADGFSLTIAP